MGCCGDNKVGADGRKSPADMFLKRRGCTDILCLVFFLLFWGGMGYITYLSVEVGDPYEIFFGSDYLGNRCGRGDFSHLPKVYYPRVEKDLIAQPHIASTQPWRLRFYGLCMSECPNVTQPQDCFANPSHCIVRDYGTPAQYTAAGGSSFYYATVPSVSVLNRCVPKAETTLHQADDRCAFPQCDGAYYAPCDDEYPTTWKLANNYPRSLECDVRFRVGRVEQLKPATSNVLAENVAGYTAGIQRLADSIVETYEWVLVFGLAVPIVLGFIWLLFLRFFAKTFTYLMIITVGVAMLGMTLYFFLLAGAADRLLDLLRSNSTELGVTNASTAAYALANDTIAKALGLVDATTDSIVSLAPSEVTNALNDAENAHPALWYVLAFLFLLLTFFYFISMCLVRKKIKLSVAIVKESANVIKDRPMHMFFPFTVLVAQAILLAYFILIVLFLGTADLDASHFTSLSTAIKAGTSFVAAIASYNATDAAGGSAEFDKYADSKTGVQAAVYTYFLFGCLWMLGFIGNIGFTALSGSVSHWFFFRDDPEVKTRVPLTRSLGRVVRYHLGSIAFGSFIVAVVQLIRILLMVIDRYTKKAQKGNMLLRLTVKCCACCMWCLEKTLKFITNYCYIYIAMQGSSFCRACFATFGLIISNPAQLSINTFVRTILNWVQLLALPVASAWLCNLVLVANNTAEPVWPTVLVALMAFIIARTFATVFACTLDTLFVCCVRDKAEYSGQYMPDRLKEHYGFNKRNKKEEDAELVSAS